MFPTVPSAANGRLLTTNQADTSATRTFPSLSSLTKNSGDLLLAIVVGYQSTASANAVWSSWGGSFTEFVDQSTTSTLAIGCGYKWSDGTETGTFTVTQAATITGHASLMLLSIQGAHPSTVPVATAIANGTTGLADPASLNPGTWDLEDTLWIAVEANGMTNATGSWTACGSTPPSNYTDWADSNTTDSSVVGQTEIAVAFRHSYAASEDCGTAGGHDVSNARNSALVVAVRPQPEALVAMLPPAPTGWPPTW